MVGRVRGVFWGWGWLDEGRVDKGGWGGWWGSIRSLRVVGGGWVGGGV